MKTNNFLLLPVLVFFVAGCQKEAAMPDVTVAVPDVTVVVRAASEVVAPAQSKPVAAPVTAERLAPSAEEKPPVPIIRKPVVVGEDKPVAVVQEPPAVKVSVETAAAPPVVAAKPEGRVPVSEADALALAKKHNCMVCHAINKKLVGPGWRDVAVKYRGDAAAESHLVNKIAKGGGGVWGSMPMPAHTQISEADRRVLARFVLNLQ